MTLTDDQLARLQARMATIAEIAGETGEAYAAVLRAVLAAGIVIDRRRLPPATQLMRMKADGARNADIARAFGVSPSAVTEAVKRARSAVEAVG